MGADVYDNIARNGWSNFVYDFISQTLPPSSNAIERVTSYPSDGEVHLDTGGNGVIKNSSGGFINYAHWVPNGSFMYKRDRVTLTGQFDEGRPTGQWIWEFYENDFHVNATNVVVTETFTDYTGYFLWPQILKDNRYVQEGAIVNGLKEGNWTIQQISSDNTILPTEIETFVHGRREGPHAFFVEGHIGMLVTYSNDYPNGKIVTSYIARGGVPATDNRRRVEGELRPDWSPPLSSKTIPSWNFLNILLSGSSFQAPTAMPGFTDRLPAKIWGKWIFYGLDNNILGENILENGNGHFKSWDPIGRVQMEGNILDGRPDGNWTNYDTLGIPLFVVVYQAGELLFPTNYWDMYHASVFTNLNVSRSSIGRAATMTSSGHAPAPIPTPVAVSPSREHGVIYKLITGTDTQLGGSIVIENRETQKSVNYSLHPNMNKYACATALMQAAWMAGFPNSSLTGSLGDSVRIVTPTPHGLSISINGAAIDPNPVDF